MASLLPTPDLFGLSTYTDYRPSQEDVIYHLATNPTGKRFTAACLPTGSGKSLDAVVLALLSGKRTVILTHTRGQQTQYQTQLGSLLPATMADMRGKANYFCALPGYTDLTYEEAPCHTGTKCAHIDQDTCYYWAAVHRAASAQIVVMNYALWLSLQSSSRPSPFGSFDLMVCDEADTVFGALESSISAEVSRYSWDRVMPHLKSEYPFADTDLPHLRSWANAHLESVALRTKGGGQSAHAAKARLEATALARQLQTIADSDDENWAVEWHYSNNRFSVLPVWPGRYSSLLFGSTPRVILMSGTLAPRTVEMLNLTPDDFEYVAYPSRIPVARRRVLTIDEVQMSARRADIDRWVMLNDNLIGQRLDRKVLLHTTSYLRRNQFMERTRHKGIVMSHGASDLELALARFRAAPAPAVFVSPAIGRGYDFPGDLARTVIIGKVPYPDGRSPVMLRRKEIDPDYFAYEAMMAIQQEAGRAVRGEDDFAETIIVDADFIWFWRKYRHFASPYFREAVEWQSRGRAAVSQFLPTPISLVWED